MSELTITLKGWDELVNTLGKINSLEAMKPAMERACQKVQTDLKVYPEKNPTSKYRRTMTLGRGWKTEIIMGENEMTGIVGNNTAYAGWVQGPTFPAKTSHGQYQAKVHQGRWQTAPGVLADRTDWIMKDFALQLEETWNAENETGNVPG